ncbi:MAG: IclR family transcriptional regulator [Deferribacteraceae bacterium]|jgi:DNA-binding IclR family transcriptional regulator|nr:IclR family transcriptional regulator [Deferribacteraceae bacterium]
MKATKNARERSEYSVQAVTNSIRMLEVLGDAEHEQSVPELCSKLKLTKSNINKLLLTLKKFGYVDFNKYTNNFRLGVKTFQISQAYINKLSLTEIAMPVLKSLRDSVDESIYVSVISDKNVVYLCVAETNAAVRVRPRIGNIGPAYATATGKVQLAFMEDRDITSFYKDPLHAYTPRTIKSLTALTKELDTIQKQGYAIDNEEYEEGVTCIAAPIKNFMGQVIAGMSISAPTERMKSEHIKKTLLPQLLEAADMLSIKFGYHK